MKLDVKLEVKLEVMSEVMSEVRGEAASWEHAPRSGAFRRSWWGKSQSGRDEEVSGAERIQVCHALIEVIS